MSSMANHSWLRIIGVVGVGMLLTACGGPSSAPPHKTPHPVKIGSAQRWKSPPPMTINPAASYRATVVTSLGTFVIQLFAKQDPTSVNNFVFLARHNFYNGDKIFRIIKPFVFQTGDPNQNGTGGPGYEFQGKIPPPFPYGPGIVAYANAGPGTNGSQFFVCTGPESTALNKSPTYPEIGRVVQGMAVVERIAAVPVTTNPLTNEDSLPTKTVLVKSITIQGP
jgi:cyclophilin family peptidyl-prolyl cis-trans isomerase